VKRYYFVMSRRTHCLRRGQQLSPTTYCRDMYRTGFQVEISRSRNPKYVCAVYGEAEVLTFSKAKCSLCLKHGVGRAMEYIFL
jgi:hypothetical protein